MEPSRDMYRRRQQQRRKLARQRAILRLWCGMLILVLAALLCFLLLLDPADPVLPRVIVEAGASPSPSAFLAEPEKYGDAVFFQNEDTPAKAATPGEYTVVLIVKGKQYESVMEVVDRTAPTATVVDCVTEAGILPEASSLVTQIKDASEVTVTYVSEPDVSEGGRVNVQVKLTDAYGNSSVADAIILVTSDEIPPVIEGAVDLEYFLKEAIAYKTGITVTDNETENPKLTVDNSQVDLSTAGSYPVTYTATDEAGNTTSVTVTLTLKERPAGYVDADMVYELAEQLLAEITTDSMTPMEVAFAIYRWTSTNIAYTGSSDKSSWEKGAYQAFTKRSGDCYNYFAAAKALFDVAGIDNVDVIKSDTSHSSHFWSLINLGDGWYHVDCTPRRNVGYFFMNTDAELEAYSVKNRNSHIFDTDAYPERATESVQKLVDYSAGKVFG